MGKVLDISVPNRRTENCLELPGLPLFQQNDWGWLHKNLDF